MSRVPTGNPALAGLTRSVYSQLAGRLASYQGPIFPLHVGDTYLEPVACARMENQRVEDESGLHRYANPRGRNDLIEAVLWARERKDRRAISADRVLITAGATAGLNAAVRALTVPGQEILVLSPHWPLIRGMSTAHGLSVNEVPFYDLADDRETALAILSEQIHANTAAVYVNWPNNPSGLVPSTEVVEAIIELAVSNDLWVITDEVYEDYVYTEGAPRLSDYPEISDRLVRCFSFSKAYGLAGLRVGYNIAPPEAIAKMEAITTYTVYSVNTAGQRAAARALREGDGWLSKAHAAYREAGFRAAERLGVPAPGGGTFLFVDVADALDERGMQGLLEDCVDQGLLISPGQIFGPGYESYVRVCFTSASPDLVGTGVEVLAKRLARG
ncbi:MAG: pyridoxal phosphate-dependent aminotransferase [Myxococcales bacterium]|nr:pyridoxal phosphate-dependent aminotransferase [Myxococcales bacterium]